MSYRTFRIIELAIVAGLASLTVYAVSGGIAWLPAPAVVIALVLMLWLRRRIKEVVSDERNETIANKAARLTFIAATLIMVSGGVTLSALSQSRPDLETYANMLVFGAGGLMIIYLFATLYYSGRMGGGGASRD